MRAMPFDADDSAETLGVPREVRGCPDCRQRFSNDARFCPFDGCPLEVMPCNPSEASEDPLLGQLIDGRYRVETRLGEGGMGRVYQVRHVALERLFAMKVLKRELATDGELATRFVREARAAASIRHPHVVAITDFGEIAASQFATRRASMPDADTTPYFVMEFLTGHSLAQLLRHGGPIAADRAARIVIQIAEAVGAAHDAGIIHRDLKPDNIFLVGNEDGRNSDDVRVLDFGAAQVIGNSRLTKKGVVFGTPYYMSPEQAQGHAVDYRSDVYALGVIMFEMFTGRVPFEGDSYMGVLTQHMFAEPPAVSTLREAGDLGALETVTMRCLAKSPAHRYLSTRALAEDIARAIPVEDSDGEASVASVVRLIETHATSCTHKANAPDALAARAREIAPQSGRDIAPSRRTTAPRRSTIATLALALGVLSVTTIAVLVTRTTAPRAVAITARCPWSRSRQVRVQLSHFPRLPRLPRYGQRMRQLA
jgi:eukaryotic-like serine/threonine-protein kinase